MTLVLHASAVAIDGKAVVITGPSGAGKSALALQLIALGGALVADDRTEILATEAALIAQRPANLPELIEVRGMGLLHAPVAPPTPMALVVDLAQAEDQRLPPWRTVTYLERTVPLVRRIDAAHFPAAVAHYMCYGRRD